MNIQVTPAADLSRTAAACVQILSHALQLQTHFPDVSEIISDSQHRLAQSISANGSKPCWCNTSVVIFPPLSAVIDLYECINVQVIPFCLFWAANTKFHRFSVRANVSPIHTRRPQIIVTDESILISSGTFTVYTCGLHRNKGTNTAMANVLNNCHRFIRTPLMYVKGFHWLYRFSFKDPEAIITS